MTERPHQMRKIFVSTEACTISQKKTSNFFWGGQYPRVPYGGDVPPHTPPSWPSSVPLQHSHTCGVCLRCCRIDVKKIQLQCVISTSNFTMNFSTMYATILFIHYFHFFTTFPLHSVVIFRVSSRSCRIGFIHFLNKWHKTLPNQAVVSFADAYVSSFLVVFFESFLVVSYL